jgi:FAD/FMN-containing dehydrogenase/Fe-S oxidoreductase
VTHEVDVRALEVDLRARTGAEVRVDAGSRAAYSTDASNYRQVPIAVVVPRSVADVEAAVAVCRENGAPVLPRGAGTSLAGQACNVAVVIDCSKYLRRVVAVDAGAARARVEPGCVLDDLRAAVAEDGLTFGPDPVTHASCTLGGMIGNNSCGVRSVVAGRTSDNVVSLDVLTYDGLRLRVGPTGDAELEAIVAGGGRKGEIYRRLRDLRDAYAGEVRRRFPPIPRRVSGYNLDELLPENGFNVARALAGTEGTCVTVLEAEVELMARPAATTLLVLGYPDLAAAGDQVPEILDAAPIGLEGIDAELLKRAGEHGIHPRARSLLPPGQAWLYVELAGASKEESDGRAEDLMARLAATRPSPSIRRFDAAADEAEVWGVREAGVGATSRLREGWRGWPGWEDAAVPPDRVGDYLRAFDRLLRGHGYRTSIYGHLGQGCIHARIDFDLVTDDGIVAYRAFVDEAADLVVSFGGSLSGEHGDGQSHAELLPKMFGAELVAAFAEFKAIWDPAGRMNPGKVVRPDPLDANLRLRSLKHAPVCVGVGACRKTAGGTMCPSYMVTLDEEHSTRGRARLLDEMIRGGVITDGWRSAAVRDALDLCLGCKACKTECPAGVDMATYKAEFLAEHYRGRMRPAPHYSMGWLPVWTRLGSRAPALINRATRMPALSGAIKAAAGVDPRRSLPTLAGETFRAWFARRAAPGSHGGRQVLIWPDTFTNHFHPDVGKAAVRVLEGAGFDVRLPPPSLCCGLTWMSTGQLGMARRVLGRTVDALRRPLHEGIPLIGLEPSCTAVFRSDATELLPGAAAARLLAERTRTLAEFLMEEAPHWQPAPLGGGALVQAHCHQQAVIGTEADGALLARLGIEAHVLDSGCCGLAGNFGFEKGHYDVSMACAERVLLPAVRRARPETRVVADGFSCRLQIDHGSGRRATHLAEVAAAAPG